MGRLILGERDLRALRVFQAVALSGGFSAAAERLHMTTATISRHIKDLEERLEVKLCTRGPQGFALTTAGEIALRRAHDVINAIDLIVPEIDQSRSVLSGELKVGMVDNIIANPYCQVTPALTQIVNEGPNVDLHVQTVSSDNIIKFLLEQRFNVVITGTPDKIPSLEYEFVFYEAQAIYKLAGRTSKQRPKLIYNPALLSINDTPDCQQYELGPSAHALQSVAFLISTGEFAGMLPVHYVEQLRGFVEFERMPDSQTHQIPFYCVTNPALPMPICVERFIQIMKECHRSP